MNRKALAPLFALLIFVAHLNCVLEHGTAAIPESNLTNSLDAPLNSLAPSHSNDCEHATGCICKGATLVDDFVVADIEIPAFGVVELDELQPFAFAVVPPATAHEKSWSPPDCKLPMRANQRCVLLQSFLI